MLTITEAVNEIKEAEKLMIKGKILSTFYKDVLEMSHDYQRTGGEIFLGFEKREDFELAKTIAQELKDNDYRFGQCVHDLDDSLDDLAVIIYYDLEFKHVEKIVPLTDDAPVNNFTADDIPF